MTLVPRQTRFYIERVSVYRPVESLSPSGRPAAPHLIPTLVAAEVPCHFDTSPSQFELEGAILSEGDNIFTLDKISFAADANVGPDDVLKVTTGHALLNGGIWEVRGELKPKTWRANKQEFVAARLAQAPAWVRFYAVADFGAWLRQDVGLYTTSVGTTAATADSDPVGLDQDAFGRSNHFSQATAGRRPLLRTGTNGINGWPALSFDAVDDVLSAGDRPDFDVGTGAFAGAVVVKGGAENGCILMKDLFGGGSNGIFIYSQSGSYQYYNGAINLTFGLNNGSPHLLGWRRTGIGAGLTRLYYDGNLVVTGTDARTLTNAVAVTLGDSGEGGHSFGGLVAEPYWFRSNPSDADWSWFQAGLKTKYGIS
jgi:hypothetical protein